MSTTQTKKDKPNFPSTTLDKKYDKVKYVGYAAMIWSHPKFGDWEDTIIIAKSKARLVRVLRRLIASPKPSQIVKVHVCKLTEQRV